MKKLIFTLFCALISTYGFAQSTTYHFEPGDTIVGAALVGTETLFEFDIVNDDPSQDLSATWLIDSTTFDSWSEYRICDNVTCYFYDQIKTDSLYNMYAISPGLSGFIKLYITPSAVGSGIMNIIVGPNGETVHFNLSSVVGIQEELAGDNEITVYPNPVNDAVNIRFEQAVNERGTASIYDLSGRVVRSSQVEVGNSLTIPTVDLPEGLYFVRLEVEKGIYFTRKFAKL